MKCNPQVGGLRVVWKLLKLPTHRVVKGVVSLLLLLSAEECRAGREQAEMALGFADYLYANEDYFRAATEYRRFLYFYPDSDLIPIAELRIGFCLLRRSQFAKATLYFENYAEKYQQSTPLVLEAWYQIMYGSFLGRDLFLSSRRAYQHLQLEIDGAELAFATTYLAGWTYIKGVAWSEAAAAFDGLEGLAADQRQREALDYMRRASREGGELVRKSPLVAGALAALVPGVGRMYLGEYGNGISSFLAIGVTGALAFRFHQADRDLGTLGWGLASAGFYLGDIYGSIVGALGFNRKRSKRHLAQIERRAYREGWLPSSQLYRDIVPSMGDGDR